MNLDILVKTVLDAEANMKKTYHNSQDEVQFLKLNKQDLQSQILDLAVSSSLNATKTLRASIEEAQYPVSGASVFV